MKIYTKTGDKGQTGLPGGLRVDKDHLIVEVGGTVDELNSMLGLVRSGDVPEEVSALLMQVQVDLFAIGARIAMCLSPGDRTPELAGESAAALERHIDQWQNELPPLTSFILPDGSASGCRIHVSRSVCRRAERQLVTLAKQSADTGSVDGQAPVLSLTPDLIYLNRLSDLLFVAARLVNHRLGKPETPWVS